MSITQGLFSDVLANAPGGSADWSKTLPMAGAVDWTKVTPFQVINPLTGYNYGATQPTQPTQAAQPEQPQLSEYQKWLAQQSQTKTSSGDGGGRDNMGTQTDWGSILGIPELSGKTWSELSPQHQAQASAIVDPYGIGPMISKAVLSTPFGMAAQKVGGLLDGMMGRVTPSSTFDQINNAYSPNSFGNLSTTVGAMAPTGGGIAANPMALDPAQAAAQDSGGGVGFGGFSSAAEQGGAGVAEANGGFSYGDASQGMWG